MTTFRISPELLDAVKTFEGLRLASYKCPGKVWTIGYGHTRGVHPGQTITEAQAESLLKADLISVVSFTNLSGIAKTQGQFDALCSFIFNVGKGNFLKSTLRTKILQQAPAKEIQAEFRRWVYAKKVKQPGLVKRRNWEARRWAE